MFGLNKPQLLANLGTYGTVFTSPNFTVKFNLCSNFMSTLFLKSFNSEMMFSIIL